MEPDDLGAAQFSCWTHFPASLAGCPSGRCGRGIKAGKLHHSQPRHSGIQRAGFVTIAFLATEPNEPTFMLADEPTGNLDSKTGEDVMTLFRDLHARGYTILLVTHERPIAEQAERIINVRDGRIQEMETLAGEKVLA